MHAHCTACSSAPPEPAARTRTSLCDAYIIVTSTDGRPREHRTSWASRTISAHAAMDRHLSWATEAMHAHCRPCSDAPEPGACTATTMQDRSAMLSSTTGERASAALMRDATHQLSPCAQRTGTCTPPHPMDVSVANWPHCTAGPAGVHQSLLQAR